MFINWYQVKKEEKFHSQLALVFYSKESDFNVGNPDLIPGSERLPEEGDGYPLHYFCLENSMARGAWRATVHGVAKSWTRQRLILHFR